MARVAVLWNVFIVLCVASLPLINSNSASDEVQLDGESKAPNTLASGQQREATFLVPQSDNIQISFSNDHEINDNTRIHMDLLTLYRDVLREVIHMDKMKHAVRNIVGKLDGYEQLMSRVEILESLTGANGKQDVSANIDSTTSNVADDGSAAGKTSTNEWLDDMSFDDGQYIFSDATVNDPYGRPEYVMHDGSLSEIQNEMIRLSERQISQQRHITDLEYSLQQERLHSQTVSSSLRLQTTEYEEARRILIQQANVLEEQALQLDVQQSTLNVQDAKINQLVLELQWKTGNILSYNDDQSKPRNLTEEFILLQTGISRLTDQIQVLQDRCENSDVIVANNESELRWLKIKIHNIRENMKKLLLLLTGFPNGTGVQPLLSLNQTVVRNILQSIETTRSVDDVHDSSTILFNIVKELNTTQRTLLSDNIEQQLEINQLLSEVDLLKGDMDDSWNQLQTVEADFTRYRDKNSENVREKEALKRRLNRMMRDIRELSEAIDSTGNENKSGYDNEPPKMEYGDYVHTSSIKGSGSGNVPQPMTEALVADPSSTQTIEPTPSKNLQVPAPGPGHNPQPSRNISQKTSNSCSLTAITEPRVVKVFDRELTGAWMKDCTTHNDIIYTIFKNVKIHVVREYNSEEELINRTRTYTAHRLPFHCTGTGHVISDGYLYCNKYKSNRLVKYHLKSQQEVATRRLDNAGFDNAFSYSSGAMTDIDLSVDEFGLWAIYSTVGGAGNITVSQIDSDTLAILNTWVTDFPKVVASNAFMACGKMYATVTEHNHGVRIAYMYDTVTEASVYDKIIPNWLADNSEPFVFPELSEHMQMMSSLQYNPVDRKLYVWNLSASWNGHLTTYQCILDAR